MAAIIAQMAAANRERKKRQSLQKLYGMASNKSSVKLPVFDRHGFDAKKHNSYVKSRADKRQRQEFLDKLTGKKQQQHFAPNPQ